MKRNLPLAVVSLALATALAGATPAVATTAGTAAGRLSAEHWITLITGDQVLTDDKGKPTQFKPHRAVNTSWFPRERTARTSTPSPPTRKR